jgi:septal ring factor EnvC (AmiA/AmiB activator)
MDPLSVTASVIAIATFALQSSKAAYDFVNGLAEAPQAIARSRASLHETQKTLSTLQRMLTTASEPPNAIEAVLRTIELDETLKTTKCLCDQFIDTLASITSHSTAGQFSKRDRFAVIIHESKIAKFNEELGDCQRTVSMVLVSINLYA